MIHRMIFRVLTKNSIYDKEDNDKRQRWDGFGRPDSAEPLAQFV